MVELDGMTLAHCECGVVVVSVVTAIQVPDCCAFRCDAVCMCMYVYVCVCVSICVCGLLVSVSVSN